MGVKLSARPPPTPLGRDQEILELRGKLAGRVNQVGIVGSTGALLVLPDPLFLTECRRIAELALKARLPTAFARSENVEVGGLISYRPKLTELFRRAATDVDIKILKGAKPTDLPVEQPTKFELVINMKTAKALGLTIPQSVILRADQAIE